MTKSVLGSQPSTIDEVNAFSDRRCAPDASHCGSGHLIFLSLLTKAGVLLYCACVDGNFLTAQNELAKAKRCREESMLGKPGILTGRPDPFPGKRRWR